jgi:hypothetical protein
MFQARAGGTTHKGEQENSTQCERQEILIKSDVRRLREEIKAKLKVEME